LLVYCKFRGLIVTKLETITNDETVTFILVDCVGEGSLASDRIVALN